MSQSSPLPRLSSYPPTSENTSARTNRAASMSDSRYVRRSDALLDGQARETSAEIGGGVARRHDHRDLRRIIVRHHSVRGRPSWIVPGGVKEASIAGHMSAWRRFSYLRSTMANWPLVVPDKL